MSALTRVESLQRALAGPQPPAVIDATVLLARPRSDGDHRAESGERRWADAHIPGSRHVDLLVRFHDPSSPWHFTSPAPAAIAAELAGLGIDADRPVVVYDTAGSLWAARLWYQLRSIGHDVSVLDGGLGAWEEAGLAVSSGPEPDPAPVASWTPTTTREAWIGKDEILAAESGELLLVCGLAESAYLGVEPSRYSRRGHIPGSRRVGARALLDDSGAVRTTSEVVAAFSSGGVDLDPLARVARTRTGERIVLYCGGGISASLQALALAASGIDDVLLYDGSLEEWSSDPSAALADARGTA